MITIRKASERGRADHGWLDTRHTFSFADYYDPDQMGFRALRVINEDRVRPGQGFGAHGHRDMEIVTVVLSGALEHRDSLGNGSRILPGDVQRMSAGSGIVHSEQNASDREPVHFLQIWILPERAGLTPSYEQRQFPPEQRQGRLRLVASRDGRDGAVTIHQDVDLYWAVLEADQRVRHELAPGRHAWIQVIAGELDALGRTLAAGDGLAVSDETQLELTARGAAELLLFDLA